MATKNENTARDRIIETALNLFYKQGYLATGINQIISESQVAKATFYANFPSKEALCLAYLQARHKIWMGWLTDSIKSDSAPRKKLTGIFSFLKEWMQESNYRGCAFLNIASEVPLADSEIRNEVVKHKNSLQKYILETMADFFESKDEPTSSDPVELAKIVYILVEGAIVSSQNYSSVWPIEAAQKAVEALIGE
ncbi:MAG: TetR/AcrR family transcriptional regulator [Desulfobulbaceae bacterium]|nr:TetR/AcrR family transcriptional regulator [Desulfobulbaceae bacterium]